MYKNKKELELAVLVLKLIISTVELIIIILSLVN